MLTLLNICFCFCMIEAGLRPQNVEFWSGKGIHISNYKMIVRCFLVIFFLKKIYIVFSFMR